MLFNSINFLLYFIVVTAAYFVMPHRFRWAWLLGASCYFYMSFVPEYILILALTIAVDYLAAIYIEKTQGRKRKLYLNISIWVTIAILFVFKYFNFFNENIGALAKAIGWNYSIGALKLILPIGLSFHTFQSLSYVIEVYRGNQKAEKHFGIYALYVMFYPQLVAGPIERPQNLLWQFRTHHSFDLERIGSGLLRMLWGLFKKVVVADRLAVYVDMVFQDPGHATGFSTVLAIIFFAFQIYCDFSGYSDIALGAAEVMGFKLMTNFNTPFRSRSVTEFWRRWHISLSTWFNDYLFTPLVIGLRDWGKWGIVFALFITFLISGLWHGAGWTFIIFGLLHGLGLIYEVLTRKTRKKWSQKTPYWLYNTASLFITFGYVCVTWIFFRATGIQNAFDMIANFGKSMAWQGIPFSSNIETKIDLGILAVMVPLVFWMEKKFPHNPLYVLTEGRHVALRWAAAWIGVFAILNFGVFFRAQSFIYFQF